MLLSTENIRIRENIMRDIDSIVLYSTKMIKSASEKFHQRESQALQLIKDSGLKFLEVGVFGSYARCEYTGRSDIDVIMILEDIMRNDTTISLRSALDDIKVQLVYETIDVFEDKGFFARQVQRDYIRRL